MKYIDPRVIVDAIAYDEKTELRAAQAYRILLEIAKGRLEAATCYLTWTEVVSALTGYPGPETALEKGRMLLTFPRLKFLELDGEVISRTQGLIGKYRIATRHAVHAACALHNRYPEIISNDPEFDKVEELTRIPLDKF